MAKNRSKKYSSPYSYQSNKKQNSIVQRAIEFGKEQQRKALKKKATKTVQKITQNKTSRVDEFLSKYTKLNPFKPMKVFESVGNVYSFIKMSPTKQLDILSRMRAMVLERIGEVESNKELQEVIKIMPRNFTNTEQYQIFQQLYRGWDFSAFSDKKDEDIKSSMAQQLADTSPFVYGFLNENVRRKAFETQYDLLTMPTLNPERMSVSAKNILAREEFISAIYKESGSKLSEEEFRQKFYRYLNEKMKNNKSKYDSSSILVEVMEEVENDVSVLDLDRIKEDVLQGMTEEDEFESEVEKAHKLAMRALSRYKRDKESKIGRKKENIFSRDYTASALRNAFSNNDRGGIV